MKQTTHTEWFYFFTELFGYRFYENNKEIPKYILFYKGYNAERLKAAGYPKFKIKIR
ncbi:hypothetical protein ACFFU1_16555 [Algibacter miyuki]|uniref:Uncharacterized protein n=1 Tax=Algibacter miyuki TaxID=1306933 RepID=A0ABV5H3P7_9FLAO|nr:hypothetical protein [Algibacter miyuki]MDN3665590.1 hypothetical protein [Algibacter miyuki]